MSRASKQMAQCHELVALSSLYLIKNRVPFQTNDAKKIKIELHNVIKTMDGIIQHKYTTLKEFHSDIFDNVLPEMIHEFITIVLAYLRNPLCIKGDSSFINIFRDYLCHRHCKQLNLLYHFVANAGIIMSGCTRIYLSDSSLKGKEPDIIEEPEFFLQQILNSKYRVSKSNIKACILSTFKKTGLRNLMVARALIEDAIQLRKETKNICKKVHDNWTEENKLKHVRFETELTGILEQLNTVILQS